MVLLLAELFSVEVPVAAFVGVVVEVKYWVFLCTVVVFVVFLIVVEAIVVVIFSMSPKFVEKVKK